MKQHSVDEKCAVLRVERLKSNCEYAGMNEIVEWKSEWRAFVDGVV